MTRRVPGNARRGMSSFLPSVIIEPLKAIPRTVTLNYEGGSIDVYGNFFAIKGDDDKFYPLIPCETISSASTTTITMGSAASAAKFDPTDDDVNEDWNQGVCFWDVSTGKIQCNTGASAQVTVSSVSGADITLAAAFASDPAGNDLLLMGGMEDGTDLMTSEIVFIPDGVFYTRMEDNQIGGAYSSAILDFPKLSSSAKLFVRAVLNTDTTSSGNSAAKLLSNFTFRDYTSA